MTLRSLYLTSRTRPNSVHSIASRPNEAKPVAIPLPHETTTPGIIATEHISRRMEVALVGPLAQRRDVPPLRAAPAPHHRALTENGRVSNQPTKAWCRAKE